jgi:hypothetical protein
MTANSPTISPFGIDVNTNIDENTHIAILILLCDHFSSSMFLYLPL